MESGLSERYTDKVSPVDKHMNHMLKLGADPKIVRPGLNNVTSDIIKMFACAAREYSDKYPQADTKFEDFVQIAYKNRCHGLNNPKASMKKPASVLSIGDKRRMLCDPITIGMSAQTADGGAAAVLCSEDFIRKHNLGNRAVEIAAQSMVTDMPSSFGRSFKDLCGYSMAQEAARKCYRDSGLTAKDVGVVEVHDCFSCNELFMYEALGLAPEGQGVQLFRGGQWMENIHGGKLYKMGGKWVVNPSGGLVSKGHPIGATGQTSAYFFKFNPGVP